MTIENCYWSETARLVVKAIPEPDPRRCDRVRLKYLCDVPQTDLDHVSASAPSDIAILADGLVLLGKQSSKEGMTPEEVQAYGHFVAFVGELIGALNLIHERAGMMVGVAGVTDEQESREPTERKGAGT